MGSGGGFVRRGGGGAQRTRLVEQSQQTWFPVSPTNMEVHRHLSKENPSFKKGACLCSRISDNSDATLP